MDCTLGPKASHRKANHLHCSHFPRFAICIFRIFRVFVQQTFLPGFAKGWFPKGRVWRMFPGTKNTNEGIFACSFGTKPGTRARSYGNKLPLMILDPPPPPSKVQKNAVSYQKMHFPAEKCIYFPTEKMHFPAEKCVFWGAHGRKPQEIAGGLPGSRIKNASQLPHEYVHMFPQNENWNEGMFAKIRVSAFSTSSPGARHVPQEQSTRCPQNVGQAVLQGGAFTGVQVKVLR